MILKVDEFLEHYGVKGMKWGVTRDDAVLNRMIGRRSVGETKEDKQRFKDYKKSTSFKDRRADRKQAIQAKANKTVEDALKMPTSLIRVGTPGYPTLMTGKEFTTYLSEGGYFDAVMTDIVAIPKESKI